jgi:hypothetical protein
MTRYRWSPERVERGDRLWRAWQNLIGWPRIDKSIIPDSSLLEQTEAVAMKRLRVWTIAWIGVTIG